MCVYFSKEHLHVQLASRTTSRGFISNVSLHGCWAAATGRSPIWRRVWWWQRSRWPGGGSDPVESCWVSPSSSAAPERHNGSSPPAGTDPHGPRTLRRDRRQVYLRWKQARAQIWGCCYLAVCRTASTAAARCPRASVELLQKVEMQQFVLVSLIKFLLRSSDMKLQLTSNVTFR